MGNINKIILTLFLIFSFNLYSQNVYHYPETSLSLPRPGMPLDLKFQLNNHRKPAKFAKIMITLDDQFYEIPIFDSYYNLREKPEYKITIPAPFVELSYQFFYSNDKSKQNVSQFYKITRNCLPDVLIAEEEIPTEFSGNKRLEEAFILAHELQLDNELYKDIYEYLQEINTHKKLKEQ